MVIKTVLPPNSLPQEKAIERANAHQISAINSNVIRDVKNPRMCPENIIPYLAWEVAVDYWDNSWSDEQKVQVIESAPYVHKHRGTAGAVRRSLASVGYPTTVIEWWQESPKKAPYTFRIEVHTQESISEETYKKIFEQTERAKNLRSHLTSIDVIADPNIKAPVIVGCAVSSYIKVVISAGD